MSSVKRRMSNELYQITHLPNLVSGSFDNFIRHSTLDTRHLTTWPDDCFGQQPLKPETTFLGSGRQAQSFKQA
jgi:hypothetical protein